MIDFYEDGYIYDEDYEDEFYDDDDEYEDMDFGYNHFYLGDIEDWHGDDIYD